MLKPHKRSGQCCTRLDNAAAAFSNRVFGSRKRQPQVWCDSVCGTVERRDSGFLGEVANDVKFSLKY
jgi:hypothetical protein